jgi:hypothetical protein
MRKLNWPAWLGFLFALFALISYPFIFVRWAVTRDFPSASLVLFAVAILFLTLGLKRAFAPGRGKLSKITATTLATLSVGLLGLFIFVAFIESRHLPPSRGAPQVGQKAPEFTLNDTDNRPVTLAELTSTPINGKTPKGVLLVFYRGYW